MHHPGGVDLRERLGDADGQGDLGSSGASASRSQKSGRLSRKKGKSA
ncbi:hypothetical protein [Nocardiopsis sp. NPDC055824]